MKNTPLFSKSNALVASTLVAGILAVSGTASAAPNQKTVVDPQQANEEVNYTLQQKVEDENGELLATQPGRVEVDENTNVESAEQARSEHQQAREQLQSQQAERQPEQGQREQGQAQQVQAQPTQQASILQSAPTLAGEAGGNVEETPITLQQKVKDKRGELEATQPGQVEVQQNRRVRAL